MGPVESARSSRVWRVGLVVLVLLGAMIRIVAFLHNPSLDPDELWLVEASLAGGIGGIATPHLFRVLEGLMITPLPRHEFAYRLLPLLFGIAALPAFGLLARRCLRTGPAIVALGILALSPDAIRLSIFTKQYTADLLVAVCLQAFCMRVAASGWRPRDVAVVALLGGVAVWLSHPACFVIGGGLGFLILGAAVRRDRGAMVRGSAAAAVAVVSFAVSYVLTIRTLPSNDVLQTYWSPAFAPFPPTSWQDMLWFIHSTLHAFEEPGGFTWMPHLAAIVAFTGLLAWAHGRAWDRISILVIPILLALAASAVKGYPFAGRLLLFAAPALYLLIARGLDAVWTLPGPRFLGRGLGIIAAVLVVVPIAGRGLGALSHPFGTEIREIVRYVGEHRQPGDVVAVPGRVRAAWLYYDSSILVPVFDPWPPPRDHVPMPETDLDHPTTRRFLDAVRGSRRVWFLFGETVDGGRLQRQYERDLARWGRLVDVRRGRNAAALLYEPFPEETDR